MYQYQQTNPSPCYASYLTHASVTLPTMFLNWPQAYLTPTSFNFHSHFLFSFFNMDISLGNLRSNTASVVPEFKCTAMVIARGNLFTGKNTNYIKFLFANADVVHVCTAFGEHADNFACKVKTGQVITITNPQIETPKLQLFGLVNY